MPYYLLMIHKTITLKPITTEFPHSRSFLAFHGIDVVGMNYVVGHPPDSLRGSRGLADLHAKIIYVDDAAEERGISLVKLHELVHLFDANSNPTLKPFIENNHLPFRVRAYLEGRAILVEKTAATDDRLKREYNLNVASSVLLDTALPLFLAGAIGRYEINKPQTIVDIVLCAVGLALVKLGLWHIKDRMSHILGYLFMSKVNKEFGQNLEKTLKATQKLIPTFFDLFRPKAYVKKLNEISDEEID